MLKLIRKLLCAGIMLSCVMICGCVNLTVGSQSDPAQIKAKGIVNGHFTANAFPKYDGEILKFGVYGVSQRPGEITSLDVWPVAGIGVGIVGVRIQILPLEMGVGVLGYDPKPIPQEKQETVVKVQKPDDSE